MHMQVPGACKGACAYYGCVQACTWKLNVSTSMHMYITGAYEHVHAIEGVYECAHIGYRLQVTSMRV